MSTCPGCGITFTSRDRSQKFCTVPCWQEMYSRKVKAESAARLAQLPDVICTVCDAVFRPTGYGSPSKYCSMYCKKKMARTLATQRGREYISKETLRRYYAEHKGRVNKKCLGCDSMSVRNDSAGYCSTYCYRRTHNKHKAIVHVPWNQVRPKDRTLTEPKQQTKMCTFYAGNCKHCGDAFISTQPSINYCSVKCSNRAAGQRRRAIKKAAFVENVYRYQVFERDDYVCQLCMKPCRRDVDVQHMQAATIDHVLALANGGQHSMSNVQTAHRLCNSLKSDRLNYSAA